jgi:3',5'-cyclic AMP phosphodiesterase CpdA
MFTLAHISDVHLQLTARPRLRALFGKRITGYLNLSIKRRAAHRDKALASLMAELGREPHDHLAVTGDLIHLALLDEYLRARDWLAGLGAPHNISVVPGNHDIYVWMPPEKGLELWAENMRGDDGETGFPYLRRRGPAAIIGLSSALVTAPFRSTGKLGRGQLARLSAVLNQTGREGLCRVVLIHHPPNGIPIARDKRLLDAKALSTVLAGSGAELVLHGHTHDDSLVFADGPNGPIPVVGVPAASATGLAKPAPAQFNLYRIAASGRGWHIGMAAHRLNRDTGRVEKIYDRVLRPV